MTSKVDKIRAARTNVVEQLEQVAAAKLDHASTKQRALELIKSLISQFGEPWLRGLASPGNGVGISFQHQPEATMGIIAAMLTPEQIDRQLDALLRPFTDGGMSNQQRRARVQELELKLRDLERQEEIEVLAAEAESGQVIPRRADADPALLLELWDKQ